MKSVARAAAILAVALSIGGAGNAAMGAAPPAQAAPAASAKLPGQPNVILIKTDDQVYDDPAKMSQFMPNLVAFMAERGVTYTNSYVASPSCCQSRAVTFVGRYGHNGGVISQGLGDVLDTRGSIPAYLNNRGYRTGLFGKYLNLVNNPPEFDEYVTIAGSCTREVPSEYCLGAPGVPAWYYNFVANYPTGEQVKILGDAATGTNYNTTWIAAQADAFLDSALADPADTPFYLDYNPTAPHTHDGRIAYTMVEPPYRSLAVPGCTRPPVETDRSDKPAFVRAYPMTQDSGWMTICPVAQRTLKTIDDWFGTVVSRLSAAGELDNTVIIFTSDNGLNNGEHGLLKKFVAYEPSVRVPLMIAYPGVFAPGTTTASYAATAKVSNVDLLPTILDLTGIAVDPALPLIDGKSLVTQPQGHRVILSEYWFDRGYAPMKPAPYPTWASIFDGRFKFIVTYSDRLGRTPVTQELYDRTTDPGELKNLIPLKFGTTSPRYNVPDWIRRLNVQRKCVGSTCL
ncbi:MAG: sulfatase-like hydrolase/transferase [Tetrasphaera sp.]